MAINQILVKSLDGTTICLQFPSQSISGEALKLSLQYRTGIPVRWQRLVSGTREIRNETLVSALSDGIFNSCSLLLRLRGGKGGFGSLLRGAATKAGQKKTNNFDACRDMSGRRLRHVNAEKRLEEWKAGEEERKLQKVAEQFLKKKAKEVKKSSSGAVEKYIEKYKEVSEKCMEEVEESVRQSFELYEKSKRKVLPTSGPASKRLKIWMGKQKVDDSDSDSDESDEGEINDNGADEKSIVLDERNQKDSEESFGTLSGSQSDGESSGGVSGQSNLEEENGISDQYIGSETGEGLEFRDLSTNLDGSPGSDLDIKECQVTASKNMGCKGVAETKVVLQENVISDHINASSSEKELVPENAEFNENSCKASLHVLEPPESQCTLPSSPKLSSSSDEVDVLTSKSCSSEIVNHVDLSASENLHANLDEKLSLDNFKSAAELEALGMEKLKRELQTHGLKCGGTLQERAARLFLLKTTSIDKLPKKLLAKPAAGGK